MKELLEKFNQAREKPEMLSNLHLELAAHFGEVSWEYEKMIPKIMVVRRVLLDEHKTAAKTDKEYEISEQGQFEKKTKIRLKSLEKLLSAVKMRIEVLNQEAQNNY